MVRPETDHLETDHLETGHLEMERLVDSLVVDRPALGSRSNRLRSSALAGSLVRQASCLHKLMEHRLVSAAPFIREQQSLTAVRRRCFLADCLGMVHSAVAEVRSVLAAVDFLAVCLVVEPVKLLSDFCKDRVFDTRSLTLAKGNAT